MRIKLLVIIGLLVCTIVPSEIFAQNANPDLTRMRLLLTIIADCNNDLKNLEVELKAYQEKMPNVNNKLYQQLKKNMNIAKKCKARSQQEYDDLKADYEGWFNESTSVMVVDRERITPIWLNDYLGNLLILYVMLHKIYGEIPIPQH